jgi:DNA-binding transcriptional ArsR family regulator
VLVEIARNPEARIRDLAEAAGITERTVQAIVTDLETAGYITRTRDGRRTRYTINPDSLFRHPGQDGHRVGPFLALLTTTGDAAPQSAGADGKASKLPATPSGHPPRQG